jgi:hypothetical protein
MPWIDPTQYDPTDTCSLCLEDYGTDQAIYMMDCRHVFHNDCLNDFCDHSNGVIRCPLCRAEDPGEGSCLDVYSFKTRHLGNRDGSPLFNGNQHILNIYNRTGKGFRKRVKKLKKTKKRLTKGKKNKTRFRK